MYMAIVPLAKLTTPEPRYVRTTPRAMAAISAPWATPSPETKRSRRSSVARIVTSVKAARATTTALAAVVADKRPSVNLLAG